ncbi:MAG: phosphate signaling complex protein PhoU [Planctomycetes bacterium]|nr:phosphate signaling complex protein PhoU [Planctomycetota bacterium]
MSVHLQREIEKLKKEVLSLCAVVEDNVHLAVRALIERDANMAEKVQDRDLEVDGREVDVEEDCLKILALHQPVAVDLRYVVATLKINNDLERIGDLAVNIARKANTLAHKSDFELPIDLSPMSEMTKKMLRDSLDAFVNMDSSLAYNVCADDDVVDGMKKKSKTVVEDMISDNPHQVKAYNTLLSVIRNLERIADHATNIAEDVIYMIEGKIVRHHGGEE